MELLTTRCLSCEAEFTTGVQHDENIARLAARKTEYGDLLLGEEIFSLRRRYGITQQAAAKIFGKGKIAFSRYENETSYPDASTTYLLELAIKKPDVIKWLADRAMVNLPLWTARCEDERKGKLRLVSDVRKPDAEAQQWAKGVMRVSVSPAASDAPFFAALRDAFSRKIEITAGNEDMFDAPEEAYA